MAIPRETLMGQPTRDYQFHPRKPVGWWDEDRLTSELWHRWALRLNRPPWYLRLWRWIGSRWSKVAWKVSPQVEAKVGEP
jgi:hypothetical protein